MNARFAQGALDLRTAEGETIEGWVGNCLKAHNDKAVIQAMSGMGNIDSQKVVNAINSQFDDFIEEVGTRRFRVRLISVPVSVTSNERLDEESFTLKDVTPYLQSFYRHGLVERANGGIVFLNRLIDHSAIENTSLSDLYALSRAIFDCAKRGTGNNRQPYIGNFGEAAEAETSWLFIPEGYFTVRHLVGVIFWDETRDLPPFIEGAMDTTAWQRWIANSLMLDLSSQLGESLQITILPPGKLFASILNATRSMMRKVANTLALEAKEQEGETVCRIFMGCDDDMPSRSQISFVISPVDNLQHIAASASVRLSIMESMEVAEVIRTIQDAMMDHEIAMMPTKYFQGSIPDLTLGKH